MTKERVRQIQNKALEKIRLVLEQTAIDPATSGTEEPMNRPTPN